MEVFLEVTVQHKKYHTGFMERMRQQPEVTSCYQVEGEYDLMQEEIYRELYLAVRELPEKCRGVFELHLEGKKNDEIAEILGISVLTVKSHKQNAIHFLKERTGNLFLLYWYVHEI